MTFLPLMTRATRRAARSRLSLLLLAALLACGPDTQEASTTTLDGDNNTQTAGVVVPEAELSAQKNDPDSAQVAAAKAQEPHQYNKRPPLNLFDVRVNLNPAGNR